ncbi:DNA repair protein [Lepidopterella palustris CBS 459.81]|uniref:DNA repair protein REV1 n=1 Tax=Lepidopterella palustris CBS 459.81 TaxID=1314670 RepID=A0A8E2EFE0_9PEZI|nr:DNA repair protein [Lepidopterella palustris CBS 459.81]
MGSRLENNSNAVRKSIESHTFNDEEGEEYDSSKFGGFSDYFRRKKIKLQNLDADLRTQSGDKPAIFRGVVAHVNGYTQPSLNDLHKLIVTHGGGFMQYLDGKTTVTHIVASSLTLKKAVEFKRYRIVKPAWVVESVKAGKLLPWNDFRVVDEGAGQKILGFDNGKVVSQTNTPSRSYRDQTDTSWYTSQIKGPGSTPSSSTRSSFLKQRPPTPGDDEIMDLPPSHQPEVDAKVERNADISLDKEVASKSRDLVTPPKTSPSLGPGRDSPLLEPERLDGELYSYVPHPDQAAAQGVKRPHPDGLDSPSKKTKLTAEEHNARLLSDPKVRKSTVVDPGFLEQYYRESRLHHLSTWKADLKLQLQALAAEKSSQKCKEKRPPGARRYILHVDFDSFFAAVSLKKYPQWKDKPAVVAHGPGNGSEIASCNYPARKFGIRNGMWMKKALELCPDLKVLPYDFLAYEEASRAFYDAILGIGGVVQSVSIDEALVDASMLCVAVGGSDGKKVNEGCIYREQAKADELALTLRNEVKSKTGCDVSVGIGGNILLAKVALRKAKPAGQHQIKPEEVLDFIGKLEVQDLPGVAWSIGGKLEEIAIKFVRDIREISKEKLIQTLGPKTGEKLWEYSRGIDRAEVGAQVVRKSVSAEVNWGVRFENQEQADEFIGSLCGELNKRLLKEKVKGRQFTMKVMRRAPDAPLDPPKHLGHGKCDTYSKSLVLGVATNSTEILTKEALSILKGLSFSPGELRGIGVQMTKLEPIKTNSDGQDSSQRKLQFQIGETIKPARKAADPIQDDVQTLKKPRVQPDHVAFGAEELNQDSPSRKPLNTLGTQFILPTQVDPKILAELPESIRVKLAKHVRSPSPSPSNNKPLPFAFTSLPAQSQLDPEILAALPADLKTEVLSHYNHNKPPSSPHSKRSLPNNPQTPFLNPPRKPRTLPPILKKPTPILPRKRGRPPKYTIPPTSNANANSTLTQSNFLATRPSLSRQSSNDTPSDSASTLDADFLAALPEDIRREVIEEHRRTHLKSNLLLSTNQTLNSPATTAPAPVQRVLQIPRPKRPTFTTRRLWRVEELREAIRAWWGEFREEGPYVEDVEALVKYLGRVVTEEKDLGKAVGVVKWMVWMVEEGGEEERGRWEEALRKVRQAVQEGVRGRGLGEVEF